MKKNKKVGTEIMEDRLFSSFMDLMVFVSSVSKYKIVKENEIGDHFLNRKHLIRRKNIKKVK